jgi:hypothetical protein
MTTGPLTSSLDLFKRKYHPFDLHSDFYCTEGCWHVAISLFHVTWRHHSRYDHRLFSSSNVLWFRAYRLCTGLLSVHDLTHSGSWWPPCLTRACNCDIEHTMSRYRAQAPASYYGGRVFNPSLHIAYLDSYHVMFLSPFGKFQNKPLT